VRCRRPLVVVGGELTLETLDLIYSPDVKFYEAPFQLKATNGMLLIDDFGRQKVSPIDLLNRWIVPLESEVDFLTLHTGKKLQVPFNVFVAFSTNLDPADLVDDAFLRRVRYKLEVQAARPGAVPPHLGRRLSEARHRLRRRDDRLAHRGALQTSQPHLRRLPAARPHRPGHRHRPLPRRDSPPARRDLLEAAVKNYFVTTSVPRRCRCRCRRGSPRRCRASSAPITTGSCR
jgi:hypothetical protein